tara:strand:- start:837 stop:1448 length:612 start_codon:yes stop_codon:yes gene_type:complete
MEFISLKNKEKKIYSISNNVNNKYIINFLARNKILISVTNEFITFGVDSIELLQNNLHDNLIKKFIYDMGSQILYLKEEKIGVKYFSIEDIVVINSNIFLFINPNKLFELLNKKHINLDKRSVNSYTYGIIDPSLIKTENQFICPELKEKKMYIFYTSSFYSLAKLVLHVFNMELDSLYYTSLYYFLTRCLEPVPENRIFLYI